MQYSLVIKTGTINSTLYPWWARDVIRQWELCTCRITEELLYTYYYGFYILTKAYCDQCKPLKDSSGIAYDLGAQESGKLKWHKTDLPRQKLLWDTHFHSAPKHASVLFESSAKEKNWIRKIAILVNFLLCVSAGLMLSSVSAALWCKGCVSTAFATRIILALKKPIDNIKADSKTS